MQFFEFEVRLGQALLDYIADTDDSDQRPILHDRQMADALIGHSLHQFDDLIGARGSEPRASSVPARLVPI